MRNDKRFQQEYPQAPTVIYRWKGGSELKAFEVSKNSLQVQARITE
jgi:hypothetical protein